MGIPELWLELGDGEITSLAKLSAEFFINKERPLRIAIDDPSWRFNNLTEAKVKDIQVKCNRPEYRGIEKNIFYRLAKLMQKNIQLLWVFDGRQKPNKNGKTSGLPADYWKKIEGVRDLLKVLKIPYHVAPGEAEAECAALQQAGIVDAVWSEDADALMFGAGIVIRDYRVPKSNQGEGPVSGHKANTKKSGDLVRVYRMDHIQRTFNLDREGLICFVLLNGGDYDPIGLRGCGAKTAMRAARSGLGENLRSIKKTESDSDPDLRAWRRKMAEYFKDQFDLPSGFPRALHVGHYCHPTVSSAEQIKNLRCLQRGWGVPLEEDEVRCLVRDWFNIRTKGYMDWIGPILLVRSLLSTKPDVTTNRYDIKLTKRRKKQTTNLDAVEPVNQPETEIKLTFLARSVSSLDFDKIGAGHWNGDENVPHDLNYRVECDMLYCFLRGKLRDELFETPEPNQPVSKKASKSKASEDVVEIDEGEPSTSYTTKKRKSAVQVQEDQPEQPRKRGRPPKKAETSNDPALSVASASVLADPPKAVFRLPTSIATLRELSSKEEDDEIVIVGHRALVTA